LDYWKSTSPELRILRSILFVAPTVKTQNDRHIERAAAPSIWSAETWLVLTRKKWLSGPA
jgi:hypothetical protein